MGGRDEKGNKKGEGGGGWKKFWKVAAATVVVVGALDSALKLPDADQVAYGGEWTTFWKVAGAAAATFVVAGRLYSRCNVGTGGSGSKHTEEEEEEEEEDDDDDEEEEKEISWTKPMKGWVKLNVDGSHWPQSESAGCGGVLRDASGKWIAGFAQKLSPTLKLDEIEKEAILKGLQWAKRKGMKKVAVESDNEGAVDAVNSVDNKVFQIRMLLLNINTSPPSPHDWQAPLKWIPRQANKVADKIAYNSHALPDDDLHEFDSPPKYCHDALSIDAK